MSPSARVEGLPAFLLVAGAIIVTPGPDMALVTRNAVAYGRAAALRTALGIEAGLLVWTAASAMGLAALLETSALAYSVVKVAGAAYLVYLGTKLLIGILRSRSATAVRRALDAITGTVLIGLGLRLATERSEL